MNPQNIEAAMENEFASYWQSDELPDFEGETPQSNDVSDFISDSAGRLSGRVGAAQIAALKEHLEAIRSDPDHPFLSFLVNATGVGWMDTPADWKMFQSLLQRLKNTLESSPD